MADKEVARIVNRVVMPGDVIGNVADLEATLEEKSKIKFGPGLREENGVILAYKAGVLRHRKPFTYLIDCNQRRVCSCCVVLSGIVYSTIYGFIVRFVVC